MVADDRVALVTAASKGIGRGCAEALARAGWRLALCARGRDELERTVDSLRAEGATAEGWPADVSRPGDLESLFARVDDAYGRLDALVSNAGGPPLGTLDDLDEDAWRTGYELTLMSVVRSLRRAVPRMREAGTGRVVVIGSSSVRRPLPGLALSNVYRPALAGLVKTAAEELGPDRITVNLVAPGRIETERVRQTDRRRAEHRAVPVEQVRRETEAAIPLRRYGSPGDLGAVVAFLASDAAGYVTGQTILVDGGMVPTLP